MEDWGRGLDTIFAENSGEGQEGAVSVKIGDIEPNRDQPRKEFDPAALSELADSIAQHGGAAAPAAAAHAHRGVPHCGRGAPVGGPPGWRGSPKCPR